MAAKTRSAQEAAIIRAKISNLYLRGNTQYAIATELGISRELVRYYIGTIQEDWKRSALFDFNLARQKELARIDLIEAEAWKAWETSKAKREITTKKSRRRDLQMVGAKNGRDDGEDGQRVPVDSTNEAMQRTEQRDPNAAYLDKIAWCVEMRSKLLGLIAPAEMRHSGNVGLVTEIFYEQAPQQGAGRLVVLGGGEGEQAVDQPALANGHVAALEPPDDFDGDDGTDGLTEFGGA